jgi:N-acetylglucosaminyl-diphospho-decaprenol L-rhamnosyltransferase
MTSAPPLAMAVVIVVSFETREIVEQCLESVMAAQPEETVVVDNGSSTGSAPLIRERFPDVRVIVSSENVGYGAAANKGIAACSTPGVLLLNGDTVLEPKALRALGAYLAERPRVAMVGPKLVNLDGTLQRSAYGYPSPGDTLLRETGLHVIVRRLPVLRERFYQTSSHAAARRVPWVLGAALAIRRSAFETVGGFDTTYFLYDDEVDLCRRLENEGFETHFAPVTTVVHLGGASTSTRWPMLRRELFVSRRRYLMRHESRRTAARVLGVLRMIGVARLLRDTIRLRVARDADTRHRLRESVSSWRALLRERSLWKP